MSRSSRQEIAGWGANEVLGAYEDLTAFLKYPADLARSLLNEGITGMKIWPFDSASEASNGQRLSLSDLDKAMEPFRQVRDAVGNSMELFVELHGLWNMSSKADPVGPGRGGPVLGGGPRSTRRRGSSDSVAPRHAARNSRRRNIGGTAAFSRLMVSGAVDIVIADLAWSGGLVPRQRSPPWPKATASVLPRTDLHGCICLLSPVFAGHAQCRSSRDGPGLLPRVVHGIWSPGYPASKTAISIRPRWPAMALS